MKVIFVDVDGVLNRAGCKVLIDGVYFVLDEKLALLKQLVERTGAKIVLSSTWRFGWLYREFELPENSQQTRDIRHFNALEEKFKEFGLEFFDRTPVLDDQVYCRGDEIDLWLKRWEDKEGNEPIESFVIIDDMNGRELRPHANRLVRTSFTKGLLQKHVDLAVKLLEKPYEG